MIRLMIFIFLSGILFSCKPIKLHEKNLVLPPNGWPANLADTGSFTISDTTHAYQLQIVLRHTDAYLYNNIWLNVGLQPPGDSMNIQKVNLELANDIKGWYGVGMNNIWELRSKLTDQPRRFMKMGTYKYEIKQIMREDPLPNVLSIGLRVESQP